MVMPWGAGKDARKVLFPALPEAVYGKGTILVSPAAKANTPELRHTTPQLSESFLALGLVVLFLLFFRYIRTVYGSLLVGLFNFKIVEKQFRENSLAMLIALRMLFAFALVSISFFGWELGLHYHLLNLDWFAPWEYFLFICGAAVLYVLVKYIVLYIVEYVSNSAPVMQMIFYFNRQCVIVCGLALFPVAAFTATGDGVLFNIFMITGLLLAALCCLLYILRIIHIFFTARISYFFLILYLCTFEIAPFLLLYAVLPVS
jgi:hypothetical protein